MSKLARTLRIALAGIAATTLITGGPGRAEAPEGQSVQGWDVFLAGLRDLEPRMLAKLTPEQRRDPQLRAEIGRLMLEAVAARTLEAISRDGDHPVFLPSLNPTLNVFQPNSDTIYKEAYITPGGTYRLRGTRGSVRIAKLGQFNGSLSDGLSVVRAAAYHDLNALQVDADGRYDVILSPQRPAGYNGDWWKLEPGTAMLILRQVASDWAKERDPTIAIERVDVPPFRSRVGHDVLTRRLSGLADSTAATALAFVDHVEKLRQAGYENRLKPLELISGLGGLNGQFYYEGAYRLADDEALVIEAKVPKKCGYYSTILTNDLWETTDWLNNQSSLNDSQSHVDGDGVLRIVVSARDPGVANWLSTAGNPRGVVQGRWTDCSDQPIPTVKLMKLSEVAKNLPPATPRVSPEERAQTVRARNAAYQQRIAW